MYICLGKHIDQLVIKCIRPFPWQGRAEQPVKQSCFQWSVKSFESLGNSREQYLKPPLNNCLFSSSPTTFIKIWSNRHFVLI